MDQSNQAERLPFYHSTTQPLLLSFIMSEGINYFQFRIWDYDGDARRSKMIVNQKTVRSKLYRVHHNFYS